jgi:hypothetical protein
MKAELLGSTTWTRWLWPCHTSPSSTGPATIRSTRWAGSPSYSSAIRDRTRLIPKPARLVGRPLDDVTNQIRAGSSADGRALTIGVRHSGRRLLLTAMWCGSAASCATPRSKSSDRRARSSASTVAFSFRVLRLPKRSAQRGPDGCRPRTPTATRPGTPPASPPRPADRAAQQTTPARASPRRGAGPASMLKYLALSLGPLSLVAGVFAGGGPYPVEQPV